MPSEISLTAHETRGDRVLTQTITLYFYHAELVLLFMADVIFHMKVNLLNVFLSSLT